MSAWPTTRTGRQRSGHRGMTMIELLIVVAVMVILLGIALPVMKTGVESRRLREAARQVNTCVELARSLGTEKGLPSGLYIPVETLPENPNFRYASRLFVAETPRPYSGDIVNAKATVNGNQVTFGSSDSASIGALGIEPGDFVKFDYKGPYFQIGAAITGPGTVPISAPPPFQLPQPGSYSYQIFRKPQRSSATAMELPAGTVIDLQSSGYGSTDASFGTANGSILVVFTPNGGVARVVINGSSVYPTAPMHFLIANLIQDKEKSDLKTYEDPATLWVSISEKSGRVTTAENGGTKGASLATAREFAQSGQAMGGR